MQVSPENKVSLPSYLAVVAAVPSVARNSEILPSLKLYPNSVLRPETVSQCPQMGLVEESACVPDRVQRANTVRAGSPSDRKSEDEA